MSEPTTAMTDTVTPAAINPPSIAVVARAKFGTDAGRTWRVMDVRELYTVAPPCEQRQVADDKAALSRQILSGR